MSRIKENTTYDIEDQLKISTVSRTLKHDRSNRIAGNPGKRKTNSIGFMVHELQSNFINSVLAGVEKITTQAGYDLIIAHSLDSFEREVANANNLFHKRVDGLIASLSFETKNLAHFRRFIEEGIPVVFFDRVEKNRSDTIVVIDNYKCGYEATQHLVEQGCRKIVHVTSSLDCNVYADRYKGYCDALGHNGIPLDGNLLIVSDLSEQAGIASANRILGIHPMPDGAFITNDFVAAVCMRTLKENNVRIPEDIAIVGFNNDAISKLTEPALTTIQYPGEEMGKVAANIMVDSLRGESSIQQISTVIIRTELIIRKSSLKSLQNPLI